MSIKRKAAPPLRSAVVDTYWIGDDAIDVEASDVASWAADANPQHLVVRQGMTPTKIRFRALTELEMMHVPWGVAGQSTQAFVQAFRYGLVSITGERISRLSINGVSGVDNAVIEDWISASAPLPLGAALQCMYDAVGIELDTTGDIVDVPLPMWLGVHILARTFCARGEDI